MNLEALSLILLTHSVKGQLDRRTVKPGSEQIQQRFQLPCWLVTLLQYMYSRQEYCCALRPMLSIACWSACMLTSNACKSHAQAQ
jgi:hypothetical protein